MAKIETVHLIADCYWGTSTDCNNGHWGPPSDTKVLVHFLSDVLAIPPIGSLCTLLYGRVQAHQDDHVEYGSLDLQMQLNCECDNEATKLSILGQIAGLLDTIVKDWGVSDFVGMENMA